ncbi:MAG TPA: sigma-70 family RNA polymerase sigma factor, partial [Myxococcota bacterium]|nr:sigma-70 family RNA polymerase sigma factor [Myxococcota bacterium]
CPSVFASMKETRQKSGAQMRAKQHQAVPAARPRLRIVTGETATSSEPRLASEPLTDKLLVQRAARGDEIAFSELVTRHYRRALRVAFGLLKDRHDAEDVLQDAFARVHARLKDFEGSSAFYTWLYRIVVNLSIDTMRKRRRERRVELEDETTREALRSGEELWPRYRDAGPDDTHERKELAAKLDRAFRGLPEIHQAVIVLRELEGFSYEEIAETLGIKKGTVMSRLFHARRGMQANLAGTPLENAAATEKSR